MMIGTSGRAALALGKSSSPLIPGTTKANCRGQATQHDLRIAASPIKQLVPLVEDHLPGQTAAVGWLTIAADSGDAGSERSR